MVGKERDSGHSDKDHNFVFSLNADLVLHFSLAPAAVQAIKIDGTQPEVQPLASTGHKLWQLSLNKELPRPRNDMYMFIFIIFYTF